jgi:acyl-coenzyme A synthetase/AMP-(fatty) acid ligase
LLVRGLSVTYGYLGDAVKTAKAFIQNPNHSRFHDPLYCTGDMVEIGDAGEFYYLGRIDNQIKHMGYRIELGEIEAALVSIADVEEGVVVYGAKPGETESEIGVLLTLASDASVGDVREQLKNRVPHYMVPTCYVLHQGEFPRTPSGKYDRKAVAALVFSAQQTDH